MNSVKKQIKKLAETYGLQIIYAFGSRAKEILEVVEGKKLAASKTKSDLDIGIKPEKPLNIKEKVAIAIFFEDLFRLSKVDVVVIPEAPISLAFEIVKGEVLYAKDEKFEAEYQLTIMRMMADLMPHLRMKRKLILGT